MCFIQTLFCFRVELMASIFNFLVKCIGFASQCFRKLIGFPPSSFNKQFFQNYNVNLYSYTIFLSTSFFHRYIMHQHSEVHSQVFFLLSNCSWVLFKSRKQLLTHSKTSTTSNTLINVCSSLYCKRESD